MIMHIFFYMDIDMVTVTDRDRDENRDTDRDTERDMETARDGNRDRDGDRDMDGERDRCRDRDTYPFTGEKSKHIEIKLGGVSDPSKQISAGYQTSLN